MQIGQGISYGPDKELSVFKLWPWPVTLTFKIQTSDMCAHTVSWNWTLVPKNMQIGQGMKKLWAGTERNCQFSNFDLNQWPWPLRYRLLICARHTVLCKLNIGAKEYANWSRNKKVMGRNRISGIDSFQTLTLSSDLDL